MGRANPLRSRACVAANIEGDSRKSSRRPRWGVTGRRLSRQCSVSVRLQTTSTVGWGRTVVVQQALAGWRNHTDAGAVGAGTRPREQSIRTARQIVWDNGFRVSVG